jgi:hypothetical protein
LQKPYLVSAGFTGLGLIMLGLIIVNVAAKRQDGAERARQMQTLTEALLALHEEIARQEDLMSERVSIEVPGWVADLFDRGVQAGLVLVAGAAAGFAVLGLAWSGVAAKLFVSLQMPYVVSGAIGGIALAGTCLAVVAVHYERRTAAADRAELEDVLSIIGDIAEVLPGRLARRGTGGNQI